MRRGIFGFCLVLTTAAAASAQAPGAIEGRVLTVEGAPAAGATVLLDGTGRQALTDGRGRYRFTGVEPGIRRLAVALAGEGTAEARVALEPGGTARADLELAPRRVPLVGDSAAGYGGFDRRALPGAVAGAQGVELRAAPVGGVLEALQGLLPGVDVLPQSTMPGSNVDVRIRGVRALDNVDDPLYVVDGLPVARIDDLSATAIASIDVLKDPAATALYGSEAKNGVVRVTTRHAADAPLRLTLNARYGAQGAAGFAPLMNGLQFAEYRREAARAAGTYTGDGALFSPEELASLQRGASTDWQRLLVRATGARDASFSAGGAVAGTRLGLRGSYLAQPGISLGQAYERGELSADAARALGPLRLSASLLQARGTRDLGPSDLWGTAAYASPLAGPRGAGDTLVLHPGGEPLLVNPLVRMADETDETTRTRVLGALAAELRLPRGLAWQARYGVDRKTEREEAYQPMGYWGEALELHRRAGTTHRTSSLESTVTLHGGSPGAHQLDLLAGFGVRPGRDSVYSERTYTGGGYWSYGWSDATRRWLLARAAYALRDRYFLTVTGRRDGYDPLPADVRHYWTGAIEAAWDVGEEPFLRGMRALSSLRLRGSVGRTDFPPSLDPRDLPQQPIWGGMGWSYDAERLDQLDGGLEASVLDGRIAAVVDVYRRDSRNQGVLAAVPAGTNYSGYALVQGSATRNTGVEVALSTTNLRGWHGLDWTSDLALTHDRGRVTRLVPGFPDSCPPGLSPCYPPRAWFVGLPGNDGSDPRQRVFYDYRVLGIWQQGEEAAAAAFGAAPGAIRIDDVNHDGRITADDRVVLGNTYPILTGSLANRLRHGAFDLSVLLAARLGYTIQDPYATLSSAGGRFNGLQRDYWTPAHASSTAPRPTLNGDPAYASSLGYRSGSHWRVRQVTLAWRLPPALAGGATARLYTGARNPWISGSFRGYDPEYPAVGAPPYRTLFLGASTSF